MYKNLVWFAAGYITCKHLVPIANAVAVKYNERLKDSEATS